MIDPFSAAIGIVGLGLQLYGGSKQTSAAKDAAAAQKQRIGLEMQQDELRRSAMEQDARRRRLETIRNAQRARALALNNAASQGAQFGSGLQGGYGQISGQTSTDLLGISQSLQSGRQMFDLQAQISQTRIAESEAQVKMQEGSAFSKLGGTLIGSMDPLARLTGSQQFFSGTKTS